MPKVLAWGKYMVTVLGSKLLLIDTKQAQIRVQFDQIWSKLEGASVASQQLLFPATMQITPADALLLEEYASAFAVTGFDWNLSADRSSVEIVGAPVVLAAEEALGAMERFMDELSNMEDASESKLLKAFALELATKSAIGTVNKEAMEHLREQLFSSANPSIGPNGKKIITELQQEDLV